MFSHVGWPMTLEQSSYSWEFDRKQTLMVWRKELRQPQLEWDNIRRGGIKGRNKEGGDLEGRGVRKRKTAAWNDGNREPDRRILTCTLPSKHNQKQLWNRVLKWLKGCACVWKCVWSSFPKVVPAWPNQPMFSQTSKISLSPLPALFRHSFSSILAYRSVSFPPVLFSLHQWFCGKSSTEATSKGGL